MQERIPFEQDKNRNQIDKSLSNGLVLKKFTALSIW